MPAGIDGRRNRRRAAGSKHTRPRGEERSHDEQPTGRHGEDRGQRSRRLRNRDRCLLDRARRRNEMCATIDAVERYR